MRIENGFIERRRHSRMQLQMTVDCVRLDPDGGDVNDRLHLIDISRGGLGAVCDRPHYPGQRVMLSLPLSEVGGQRNIYASVVRCRQREDGYHVGLEFDASSIGSSCGMMMGELVAA